MKWAIDWIENQKLSIEIWFLKKACGSVIKDGCLPWFKISYKTIFCQIKYCVCNLGFMHEDRFYQFVMIFDHKMFVYYNCSK